MYNLTINNSNKVYNNFKQAKSVLERALRIAKANQKKYDGFQVLNYMSIDEVEVLENGILNPIKFDLVYVCGSELTTRYTLNIGA